MWLGYTMYPKILVAILLVFFEDQGNTAGVFVVIAALTVIGILACHSVVIAEKRVLHYLPSAERRVA
jgi:NitT/TauT family transport system permease protein